MQNRNADTVRQGVIYAVCCYAVWGLFPLYWRPINDSGMAAGQILAQRIVWSALFASALLAFSRQKHEFAAIFRQPALLGAFALSAFCIALNWLVYLWAIVNEHLLDASLGYFLSPLVNVFLGRLVFKDPLNKIQAAAIALALGGILWLAVPVGHIPWVALLLAASFGAYGLIRKLAPMSALAGIALETLLMLPFAGGYLLWCAVQGGLVFSELTPLQTAVLVGSGAATTIPLLLFGAAVKRAPLGLVGIVQYFSPTLQFLTGWLLFGEPFDSARLSGFAIVWLAVAVFLYGLWRQRKRRAA